MNFDFSADITYFDNQETIAYSRQHNPDYTDSTTITTALRMGTWRPEGAPSGGVYTKFKTGWQIKPNTIGSAPVLGETTYTINGGTNYPVLALDINSINLTSVWIAGDTINIYNATAGNGEYIIASVVWTGAKSIVTCTATGSSSIVAGTAKCYKNNWLKPGDEITDSDNRIYTVLSVQKPIFNSFWGIDSIKLDIETALDDIATWYRQTEVIDLLDPDHLQTEIPYQTNVSCRIQPNGAYISDVLAKRGMVEKFLIYVNTTAEPQYGDIFTLNGETPQWSYKVTGWNSKRRIDELLVLETEIIP